MKAQVLYGIGDLRYEEIEKPKPKKGEVLVKVMAAGICGSDVPRVFQTGAHRHPLIIGHEFSGIVESVGEDVSAEWIGKPVGVFPLIPCRDCLPCRRQQYEMCRSYNYLGSRCDGGFAEYAAVPVRNVMELPEGVSYEAAAMLEPMAVAVHAMRRASVKPEDTVVVCGLGTIGLLLCMFLKELGVSGLLAIGNKESQRELAMRLGIREEQIRITGRASRIDEEASQETFGDGACRWIDERTDGRGADIFFECVGKNETAALAVRAAAPAGTVMFVGNPYSDMTLPKDHYWKILRNQLTILGTWNSSYTGEEDDDWHYVIRRLASGDIEPEALISHRLELSGLAEGLAIMRDKTEDYVKIMVRT